MRRSGMTGTLIATTPKSGMHALAWQGIAAASCYAQIREMLQRKFGDEYVLLFARPADNAAGDEIDWYSPVQGPVQKLSGLAQEEQDGLREVLAGMAAEILRYAEELIASGDHLKVTRGNILRLALSCPDDDCLYVVGKQPVFICWGYGPGTPGVEPVSLSRAALAVPVRPGVQEAAVAPEKARPKTPGGRYSFWWWLFPLAALLLLALLLFGGFGRLPPLSGTKLFDVPGTAFMGAEILEESRLDQLRGDIETLQARLKTHVAMCLPRAAEPPAQRGAANLPALEIPDQAADPDFLEGKWLCETGLYSERTNEPLRLYLTFGGDGRGQAVIYEKNGQCRGDARAKMENGRLLLELGKAECGDRRNSYRPVSIECVAGAERQAECRGRYEGGKEWKARFIKAD